MIDFENSPRAIKAVKLFKEGYNCSQAVVGAWCDELGMNFKTAVAISAGFGGGMGRMREVCGACTGAFMVLGLKYGGYEPADREKKAEMYSIIQRFAERFKEENGFNSIICRELLGAGGKSTPTPSPRTAEYYKKRPCPDLVGISAVLLEEFI